MNSGSENARPQQLGCLGDPTDDLPDLPNDDSKENEASQHQSKHGGGVYRPVHRHQEVNGYHDSERASCAEGGLDDKTTLFMDGEIVKMSVSSSPAPAATADPLRLDQKAWVAPLAPFRPEERRCAPTSLKGLRQLVQHQMNGKPMRVRASIASADRYLLRWPPAPVGDIRRLICGLSHMCIWRAVENRR